MPELLNAIGRAPRSLSRRPGFALTAVITLALGVGVNVVLFSAIHAVLLRPLPYPEPDRLVRLFPLFDGSRSAASAPNFLDFRDQADAFAELVALSQGSFTLAGNDRPAEMVPGTAATEGFFRALGVEPAVGRPFIGAELEPGGPPAVVLSHELWQRRFGGDPEVAGRRIRVDGRSMEVVGIMPPGFAFPERSELWTPLAFSGEDLAGQRGGHYLEIVGRLGPGVTLEQANGQVRAIARRLEAAHPEQNTGYDAEVVTLREAIAGAHRPALLMLLGAAALVFLIACANVANLLLARALERRHELSVRAALGASSRALLQATAGEAVVVCLLGGAAALVVAGLGIGSLTSLDGLDVPRLAEARLDAAAFAVGAALTLLTGLAAGVLPALGLTAGGGLGTGLAGTHRSTDDRGSRRLRTVLVTAEIALAVVLLFGAGLLARSFAALQRVDPGFDPDGVVTFNLFLNEEEHPDDAGRAAFAERVLARFETLSGVSEASLIMGLPLSGMNYTISVEELDGRPAYDRPGEEPYVRIRVVSPGYFRTLGVPVLDGRGLTERDRRGSRPVAVVNRAAAELLWPGENPLGHTLRVGTGFGLEGGNAGGEVVGVVGDVRSHALTADPVPELYVAHAQFPIDWFTVALETEGDPAPVIEALRPTLHELDPRQALFRVRTMDRLMADSVAQNRLYALLLGLFAATALSLAAVGIYGVVAYAASRRLREVGIRMALGASRRRVLALLLRQGLGLAAGGGAAGLLLALSAGGLLKTWLYRLEPHDPLTLAGSLAFLAGVTLAASLAPARRAARVDPVETLQQG
ncbi:MAG: ABC transporter permease [bacterium]